MLPVSPTKGIAFIKGQIPNPTFPSSKETTKHIYHHGFVSKGLQKEHTIRKHTVFHFADLEPFSDIYCVE